MFKNILAIVLALFVSACASNVKMGNGSNGYIYSGEKYGKVTIVLSDAVTKDSRKVVRTDQLNLESKIKSQLRAKGVYDEYSANKIEVVINKIHIRNAFNAIMFGFMSGADSLDGTVFLKNDMGNSKANFNISATYALGGTGGGQNETRLGWLSEKFAELTANTIVGNK